MMNRDGVISAFEVDDRAISILKSDFGMLSRYRVRSKSGGTFYTSYSAAISPRIQDVTGSWSGALLRASHASSSSFISSPPPQCPVSDNISGFLPSSSVRQISSQCGMRGTCHVSNLLLCK